MLKVILFTLLYLFLLPVSVLASVPSWKIAVLVYKNAEMDFPGDQIPISNLQGSYFNNKDLSGNPVLTRNDTQIDFDWNGSKPAPEINNENFSVRWTGNISVSSTRDLYFNAEVDDGVKVFLDGNVILDQWKPQISHYYVIQNVSAGNHEIKVEYFQGAGGSHIHFFIAEPKHASFQMTDDEIQRTKDNVAKIPIKINTWSNNAVSLSYDLILVDRPMTTEGNPVKKGWWWASPVSTKTELDTLLNYDSVFVLWPSRDSDFCKYIESCGWGWGIKASDWTKGMTYGVQQGIMGTQSDSENLLIHEWLHGVTGFFSDNGFNPQPDIDKGDVYGYVKGNDEWSSFYADVVKKRVRDPESGNYFGIDEVQWSSGKLTNPGLLRVSAINGKTNLFLNLPNSINAFEIANSFGQRGIPISGFVAKINSFWKDYLHNFSTDFIVNQGNNTLIVELNDKVMKSQFIMPLIPYPLSGQAADTLDFFLNGIKRDFPINSQKIKTGFSVNMPYLNFVKGSSYDFDPTFLNEELNASINQNLPIVIDFNGHRYTYEPNYLTLINFLAQDSKVFMYNQEGIPINQISEWQNPEKRPGSDLWSLNIFNEKYRLYKKKNIQQAGQIIAEFAKNHPDLFAGISLDSEISFCPAGFATVYNFDFNPETLIQYRMWLAGSSGDYPSPDPLKYSNPYLSGGKLAGTGRNLRLFDVNTRYGTSFTSWDLVFPPKSIVNSIQPIEGTNNTQWQDWLSFKSSMTNEMLNTMKQWLIDVDIPKKLIFSHQPIYTDTSPSGAYAFCGISFDSGTLTEANYGITAYVNLTQYDSTLANIRRISPIWGIFEWNPFSASSQSVQDILNTAFINNKAFIVSPNFYLPRRTGDINTTFNIYDNPAILEGIRNFINSQN